MSLVELLVTVTIGMVVLFATGNLLDASGRASAEVQDRVDAVQRGRVAMEQVTQRLRSQVCLNATTPAVTYAGANEMWFYTDLGDHTAGFVPEARKLRFVDPDGPGGKNGSIVEEVWDTVITKDANGNTLTREQAATATFGQPVSRTRTMIEDVSLSMDEDREDRDGDLNKTEVVQQPLFDYYRFLGVDPATPNDRLQPPVNGSLTTAQMERVVRVVANFDARPSRGPATRDKLDTRFETDVFVRTADPTDPDNSPSCL